MNSNGPLAREVFYRLAKETGGAVWDQFQVMGGIESMEKWRKANLAKTDRVHFTVAGYRLIGDLFSNALFQAINNQLYPPRVSDISTYLISLLTFDSSHPLLFTQIHFWVFFLVVYAIFALIASGKIQSVETHLPQRIPLRGQPPVLL